MKKLILGLLLLIPTVAFGQITRGSILYFDHTATEQEFVEIYQLCTAPVNDQNCRDIAAERVGTEITLRFTLPASVPNGRQDLSVRAKWKAPFTGYSGESNVLSIPVVGSPGNLRTIQ